MPGTKVSRSTLVLRRRWPDPVVISLGRWLRRGVRTDGISNVNAEIFEEFAKGKNLLLEKECDAVMGPTNRIIDLMTVPLIQGTLRYTYFWGKQQDDREAASAEMAVFAAAVLPRVHACSAADASIIYADTKAGTDPADVDFDAVKLAFRTT